MNPSVRTATLVATLVLSMPLASGAAGNNTVYRCGQTYQQTPCPAGQVMEVSDTRDASQRVDAKKALAADQALAKQLAAERRERDKALKPQTRAVGVPISPPWPATSAPAKHPDADPCRAKGGKHAKSKKIKCVDGAPVYTAPSATQGR